MQAVVESITVHFHFLFSACLAASAFLLLSSQTSQRRLCPPSSAFIPARLLQRRPLHNRDFLVNKGLSVV